jgi:hypothetical protein
VIFCIGSEYSNKFLARVSRANPIVKFHTGVFKIPCMKESIYLMIEIVIQMLFYFCYFIGGMQESMVPM